MATKRSEETKHNIQQAFLNLLIEKPYESLTMEEIAQAAGRSRVTVHRHYNGKEQVLLDCLEVVIEEVKDLIAYPNNEPHRNTSEIAHHNLKIFYAHVAENHTFYRALFSTAAGTTVRTRLRRIVAGVLINLLFQDGTWHQLKPTSPNMVANLVADLVVGAVIWWLESGSEDDPAVLAEIVLRVAETGVFGLMGRTPTAADISYYPFTAN